MTLRKFITKSGAIPRGAVARVAQYLRVNPKTVRNWLSGEWTPGTERLAQIDEMIAARISLAPDYRKCGRPKGSRKKALA